MRNLEEKILRDLQEIKDVVKGTSKVWMGIDECAARYGISKNSLYAKVAKKEWPSYRVGKRIIFKTAEIDNLLETNCKVKSLDEVESDVSTSILKKKIGGVK